MLGSSKKSPQKELFAAVEQNDTAKVQQLLEAVKGLEVSLGSPVLSDPNTGGTLLHHAVMVSTRVCGCERVCGGM